MFPAKPGVMEARELTADDVVFSYNYRHNSPKRPPGINDEFTKAEALDRYTVAFYMKQVRGRLAVLARLRLQLVDHAEGGRRCRRRRLEER